MTEHHEVGWWAAHMDEARQLSDELSEWWTAAKPDHPYQASACIEDLCDRIEELEEGISEAISASHIPGDVTPTFRDLDDVLAEVCARLGKVTREGKAARRQAEREAPEPIAPGDYRYYRGEP